MDKKEPVASQQKDPVAHTEKTPETEEAKAEEQPKRNFSIALQKILLCTDKTEMYAQGSVLVQEILAAYLHVPIQSKDLLVEQLKQSSKPEGEKENILQILHTLQEQINRGLYSPLFSESDKLNLVDNLNALLRLSKL